jgi:signal transduction histidine kinase
VPNWRGPERVARVDLDWVTSAAGRRVLVHWADPRPAWLWSPDPSQLIWRNHAARFFGAKLKKHGLRLAAEPVPIKGQIARLIRLGSSGRSSLARVQFLAGGKPVASTCTATPLQLPGGTTAVLLVGVDPIDAEILTLPAAAENDDIPHALLPAGAEYLLIDPEGQVTGGTPQARDGYAQAFAQQGAPDNDVADLSFGDETLTVRRLTASPRGHRLLLLEGIAAIAKVRSEEGISALDESVAEADAEAPAPDEPLLPMGLAPIPSEEDTTGPQAEAPWVEPFQGKSQSLSSLFDRLAGDEELFTELSADDEHFVPPPARVETPVAAEASAPVSAEDSEAATDDEVVPEAVALEQVEPSEPDAIGAIIEFDDDLEDDRALLYRVTGRGFTPEDEPASAPSEEQAPTEDESRRNFSELRRILSDRVAAAAAVPPSEPVVIDPPIEPVRQPAAVSEGALINIAAETFILNRLPLGIMVFRDQQVLFANRAFTDLVGYETIDSLRNAGIKAIFPGDDSESAGPVTHLMRRDGTSFPVTARLQSITWQGRPALMLSASSAEPRPSHEGAVRAFAELFADVRREGFVAADRAGRIVTLSAPAYAMLRRDDLAGQPISALIHEADIPALRLFLEEPARFAETTRPSVSLKASVEGITIVLFAEGQAGIITGYFGLVQHRQAAADRPADTDVDPSMLVRVSRGVRRPLNTIIGFADLIRSAAFGTIENHRYLEYARDIKTAGQEIAVLVDELDDYARLRAGNYTTRPAELDLGGLIDSCLMRVRGQASAARVLVRSAVSERLPRVRADRASLGQALLNLLASAIDQSPPGGTVILSAQPEDDGSVVVNVRDSGAPSADPGERFVVFRDGVGKDGEALAPVRSSVGLALTRSLVAVNACTLTVTPAGAVGTLFSLTIPADLIATAQSASS